MILRSSLPLVLAGLAPLVSAQNGDRPGEEQPPLPADLVVPPAPALSVDEARAAFVLPPELEITCIASEPLVEDPVDVAFDGDGRLWVVEMRAYMPDVDGTGETAPTGRIAVLRDEDGDGVMDARTEFVGDLVLPRAVMPYRDGALVIAPPELRFYRDTDGDGVADVHEVIERGLGGIDSPEHAINAPRWSHDNWIQLSNHRLRYREGADGWERQRTNGGGQWGLSFDELGRAFFDTNSDALRGDAYSSHYAVQNPSFGTAGGVNLRVMRDQTTWPARINPGVNRGYRPETLRDDFTLRSFTGACGPLVYLGDALPAEYRGDAFVAEPCGNLVKRLRLFERGPWGLDAENAYAGREFLASTDERFRPVNLVDGPDGALYVVDLYRGLIQHRLFVTSWLRAQVLARGLEQPLHMGRIWRIAARDAQRRAPAPMSAMSWTELVGELGSANGFRRITAQRLVVEEGRGDADATAVCRQAALESAAPLGRAHALYALAGLGRLTDEVVLAGLAHADRRVRLAALRCAEEALSLGSDAVRAKVVELAHDGDRLLAHQALLSLGAAHAPSADAALAGLLLEDASDPQRREAAAVGLHERELDTLRALVADARWALPRDGGYETLRLLASCVVREARSDRVEGLLALVGEALARGSWHAEALVDGMLDGRPVGPTGQPGAIHVPARPACLDLLAKARGGPREEKVAALEAAITWPGGPGGGDVEVRALTPEEIARFEAGRLIFNAICSTCHQPSGLGEEGKAPPLRHSPWVLGPKKRPIRVLLGGLVGPIELGGKTWDLEMPVYNESPENVAAVLTYVRREWGHGAEPVTPDDVRAVLEEMKTRTRPWTVPELEALKD
ncbi:MAG: dehydrogenase [Planctomycetes bacterium]|nr:dehydrogenase [Planctomycetota bacterium]